MIRFDNRWHFHERPSRAHLSFVLGGRKITYAYIRKNGCASFKRALGFHPSTNVNEIFPLYPYSPGRDVAIFVYRDPLERMVSLYKSKMLEIRGAEDLLADYESVMGEKRPTTFERFAEYIVQSRDPHCWRQVDHLKPILYRAIPLSSLYEDMCCLVGEEAAEPWRLPVNQSTDWDVPISRRARLIIERHFADDYRLFRKLADREIRARDNRKVAAR